MEEISQELAARMAACLRDAVKAADGDETVRNTLKEARAIAAMLPKPIDPDIEEVRAVAFKYGWGRPSNESHVIGMGLALLKRGRELAKARAGEGSV